eukprot:CAMPEP_0196783456 /NCGR_PEP_ID=MMETSP1104-20130614/13778_1 /TAXON_ID=33652 /ORGANISM="Cafeteria sp., Strain Caron Lab Isolate" /LENGTH=137 /DNA_ID=CAMNT_0042153705 /DNA_START=1 /DNA_END=414 /DNA_ORIENTATION=+
MSAIAPDDAELPSDEMRLTLELEFVQSLANPEYLRWLQRAGYFEDEEFVAFLEYLSYFQRPHYATLLTYPQCLTVLARLQDSRFREMLKQDGFIFFLQGQIDMSTVAPQPASVSPVKEEEGAQKAEEGAVDAGAEGR